MAPIRITSWLDRSPFARDPIGCAGIEAAADVEARFTVEMRRRENGLAGD